MANRELANEITSKNPNLTWDQAVEKAKNNLIKKGKVNFMLDDIFDEIINSSQRSRKSVNKELGL